MNKAQEERRAGTADSGKNPASIHLDGKAASQTAEQAGASSFSISADQLQSLADEVGAALVNYVVRGGQRALGEEIAVSSMDAGEWSAYFRLAFGAVSAADDGVILGDFMFKDTARHYMDGSDYVVAVRAREVELYLKNAFGPEVTLAAIGKSARDGNVLFAAMSGEDPDVVAPLEAWHEADVMKGHPLQLEFRLEPAASEGDTMRLDLQVHETSDPQYGCFVTAYQVTAV